MHNKNISTKCRSATGYREHSTQALGCKGSVIRILVTSPLDAKLRRTRSAFEQLRVSDSDSKLLTIYPTNRTRYSTSCRSMTKCIGRVTHRCTWGTRQLRLCVGPSSQEWTVLFCADARNWFPVSAVLSGLLSPFQNSASGKAAEYEGCHPRGPLSHNGKGLHT